MKRYLILSFLCFSNVVAFAQNVELLPYGELDTWTVRYIRESRIIGGMTKALYMVASLDTVYGTEYSRSDSPWSTGNAYARALWVNKVSVSVVPERRGHGYCCRMETRLDTVRVAGFNLYALTIGSLYTGVLANPVTMEHCDDPNSAIDMGMTFTRRPIALVLDYKAKITDGEIVRASAGNRVQRVPGRDAGQITLILQHRWEKDGHIYAYRVGTASEYISKSTQDWVNNHEVKVRYAAPETGSNKPADRLINNRFKTRNSEGKMVFIEELDWRSDVEPTHIIVQISAGCQKPFTGCPGNVVWCDNIRLMF